LASGGGEPEPHRLVRPLLDGGYLAVENPDAPRAEQALRVPDVLWRVLRGDGMPARADGLAYRPARGFPSVGALVLPDDLRRRVGRVAALLREGGVRTVVVRGIE